MANSFSPHTCSCSLLLSMLICLTVANGYPVDHICHQTTDPQLCLQALGGPQFRNETLENLADLGFEGAQLRAIGCQSKFESLMSKQPDPKMKSLLGQCKKVYDQVLAQFRPAHKAATEGRWAEVPEEVGPVPGDIDRCEKLFNNNSPVHEDSKEVRVAVEAILVIAKVVNH